MELKDARDNPIQEGIYVNSILGDSTENTVFYNVYSVGEDRVFRARDHSNHGYKLDYPNGLPDSSRVPEGVLDPTTIKPMDFSKDSALKKLDLLKRDLEAKIRFLKDI